jgi:hypothetical protein
MFYLTEDKEKKQHDAVMKNQKATVQFALSFSNVLLLNKLNCKKCMDKINWPTGKAHYIMSAIVRRISSWRTPWLG